MTANVPQVHVDGMLGRGCQATRLHPTGSGDGVVGVECDVWRERGGVGEGERRQVKHLHRAIAHKF